MKGYRSLFLLAAMALTLVAYAGCGDENSSNDTGNDNVIEDESASEDGNTSDDDSVSVEDGGASGEGGEAGEDDANNSPAEDADTPDDTPSEEDAISTQDLPEVEPLPLCSLSEEEIIDYINSFPNLKASEDTYVRVPSEAQLFDYIEYSGSKNIKPDDFDYRLAIDQFVELFHYIFPNRDFDEDSFFYSGSYSKENRDDEGKLISHYELVRDRYDAIVIGEEATENDANILLRYDERYDTEWKIRSGLLDTVPEMDSEVGLEVPTTFGYGYFTLNKGKATKIAGIRHHKPVGGFTYDDYIGLLSFWPEDIFDYVGTYPPDSEASFKLLDGETRICDAVGFFEEYVNGFPYPENPMMDVTVTEVDVLQVDEDTYGYSMLVSGCFRGVPFDRTREGSYSNLGIRVFRGGTGFMIESDDVDCLDSYRRIQAYGDYEALTDAVDFEAAASTVSDRMTGSLQFEVRKVELVYREDYVLDEKGQIPKDIDKTLHAYPSWRFTLINDNDGKLYYCYVNAGDAEDFSYIYRSDEYEWNHVE